MELSEKKEIKKRTDEELNKIIKEAYQKYLDARLPLLFSDSSSITIPNIVFDELVKHDSKSISENMLILKRKNGKYSIANLETGILSKMEYDSVSKFQNGIALVETNNKYFFIDKFEKNINGELYDKAYYCEGHLVAKKGNDWFLLNENGKIKNTYHLNGWINPYKNGFAKVYDNSTKKYYFLDGNFNRINEEEYDLVEDFTNGRALVKMMGTRWFFLDESGKRLFLDKFPDGFLSIDCFYEDAAIVTGFGHVQFFIDKNGNLKNLKGYILNSDFHEGYAIVKDVEYYRPSRYHYINLSGDMIGEDFSYASDFRDGVALVTNFDRTASFYIDRSFNIIAKVPPLNRSYSAYQRKLDKTLEEVRTYRENMKKAEQKRLDNLSKSPDVLYECDGYKRKQLSDSADVYVSEDNCTLDEYGYAKLILPNEVKKSINGKYRYRGLELEYYPCIDYGRYLFCKMPYSAFSLIDTSSNENSIDCICSLVCSGNMIYWRKDNEEFLYLIKDNQLIDISFYADELKCKKKLHFDDSVSILSLDEFCRVHCDLFSSKKEKIMAELMKIYEENEAIKERQRIAKAESKNKALREESIQYFNKLKQFVIEADKMRISALKKMHELVGTYGDVNLNIPEDELEDLPSDYIVNVGDHKVIHEDYRNIILQRYKLEKVNFKDVDVRGVNFSYCKKLILDPQKVYNRSLRGCKFYGVPFDTFTNFDGVDICECHLYVNDLDSMPDNSFAGAIWDDKTMINGQPFSSYFGVKRKK